MQPFNYVSMSASYLNCFIGLFGVSMTVLAIVLGFNRNRPALDETLNKSEIERTDVDYQHRAAVTYDLLLPHLVAALIISAISCIVGVHLMSKTASLVPTPMFIEHAANIEDEKTTRQVLRWKRIGQAKASDQTGAIYITEKPVSKPVAVSPIVLNKDPQLGATRLYQVSSAIIYISGTLFLFSIMLLPLVYTVRGWVKTLSLLTFLSLQVGAGLWVWNVAFSWHQPFACFLVAVVVWVFFWAVARGLAYPSVPFLLCLLAILVVGGRYAFTLDNRAYTNLTDVIVYSWSATLAPFSLLGLYFRLYYESTISHDPEFKECEEELEVILLKVIHRIVHLPDRIFPKRPSCDNESEDSNANVV